MGDSNNGIYLDDDNFLKWNSRYKRNCFVYILLYGLLGGVSGITLNTMISYLDIIAPKVITGLNIYTAIGQVIVAILLLYVHKVGYKKILLIAPAIIVISLVATILTENVTIVAISYILITAGVSLYDFMYPLMYTSYVPRKKRTSMMSLVMCVNLIVQAIVAFFGGKFVVWILSIKEQISYTKASILSSDYNNMSHHVLENYIFGYKAIIVVAIILTVLAFFSAFLLKEKRQDYVEIEAAENDTKQSLNFKILAKKDVVLWLIFLGLTQIGILLVVPYFPIYLNNFLHIQRGTVSTIISLQTLAMVIGYAFAPWLEKKLGSVVSNAVTTIACIPMMLLIARGNIFGSSVAIMIGIIMFIRSGLANTAMPIQQSLQMILVSKDMRPAFSSLMTIVNAVIGIVVGLFTQNVLLKTNAGYGYAYYITSIFYFIASILLLIFFTKKYNRAMSKNKLKKESN